MISDDVGSKKGEAVARRRRGAGKDTMAKERTVSVSKSLVSKGICPSVSVIRAAFEPGIGGMGLGCQGGWA